VAVFLVVGFLGSIYFDLLLLKDEVGDSKFCSCFSVVCVVGGVGLLLLGRFLLEQAMSVGLNVDPIVVL